MLRAYKQVHHLGPGKRAMASVGRVAKRPAVTCKIVKPQPFPMLSVGFQVLRLASEFRSVTMVIWCPEPGSNELFLPKVNYSHVPFTPTRSIIEKSCENAFTACPGWQIDDVRL